MQFVRTIVESDRLINVVSIPDELKHQEVELLILPIKVKPEKSKNQLNPEGYRGILHIKNIEKEIQALRDEWERL